MLVYDTGVYLAGNLCSIDVRKGIPYSLYVFYAFVFYCGAQVSVLQ